MLMLPDISFHFRHYCHSFRHCQTLMPLMLPPYAAMTPLRFHAAIDAIDIAIITPLLTDTPCLRHASH